MWVAVASFVASSGWAFRASEKSVMRLQLTLPVDGHVDGFAESHVSILGSPDAAQTVATLLAKAVE